MVLTLTLTEPLHLTADVTGAVRQQTTQRRRSGTVKTVSKQVKRRTRASSKSVSKPVKQHDIDTYITQSTTTQQLVHTVKQIIDTAYRLYSEQASIVDVNRLPLMYILDAYDTLVKSKHVETTIYNVLLQMSADTTVVNWYDKLTQLQYAVQHGVQFTYDTNVQYLDYSNNAVLYEPQYSSLQSDLTDLVYYNLVGDTDASTIKQLEPVKDKQNSSTGDDMLSQTFRAWYTLHQDVVNAKRLAAANITKADHCHHTTGLRACYSQWRRTHRSNVYIKQTKRAADALQAKLSKQSTLRAWQAQYSRARRYDVLCVAQVGVYNKQLSLTSFRHWVTLSTHRHSEQQLTNKADAHRANKLLRVAMQSLKLHRSGRQQRKSVAHAVRVKHQRIVATQLFATWKLHTRRLQQYKQLRTRSQQTSNKLQLKAAFRSWRNITAKQRQLAPLLMQYEATARRRTLHHCTLIWLHDKRIKQLHTAAAEQSHNKHKLKHCFNKLKQYTNRSKYAHVLAEQRFQAAQTELLFNCFYRFAENCRAQKARSQREAIETNYQQLLHSTGDLFAVKTQLKQAFDMWQLAYARKMYLADTSNYVARRQVHAVTSNAFSKWRVLYKLSLHHKCNRLSDVVHQWQQYAVTSVQKRFDRNEQRARRCINQWRRQVVISRKVMFMNKLIAVNAFKRFNQVRQLEEQNIALSAEMYNSSLLRTSFSHMCYSHQHVQYEAVLYEIADKQYMHRTNKNIMTALAMNLYRHLQQDQAAANFRSWQERHVKAVGLNALLQHKTVQQRKQKLTAMQRQFCNAAVIDSAFHFWQNKHKMLSVLRRVTVKAHMYRTLYSWQDNSVQLQHRVQTMTALAIQRNDSLVMSQAYNQWRCTITVIRKMSKLRKHIEAVWTSSVKRRCFMQLKRAVEQRKARVKQARVMMYTALLKQQLNCVRGWHNITQQCKQIVVQTQLWQQRQLYLHQRSALQQWHRSVTAKKSRQDNYEKVQLLHDNHIKADTIRSLRTYMRRHVLALQFSARHNGDKVFNAYMRWLGAYRRVKQLEDQCDEYVEERNNVYLAQLLQYWRHVSLTKVANRDKLLRVQVIHRQLCCRTVVATWRQSISAVKLTQHNQEKHQRRLLSDGYTEWLGHFKQILLNRQADAYIQSVRMRVAVDKLKHNVATIVSDRTEQQSVSQAVTVILLKHRFLHWKQYLLYTHKIDAVAEQHYQHRRLEQSVQQLHSWVLHKRNVAVVQQGQTRSVLQQAFSIWLKHSSPTATVSQTYRLRYTFRLWCIHHREHQYNAQRNMLMQQQCLAIWVRQHDQTLRMSEQEAVGARMYTARIVRQCYVIWLHELKQQQRLNTLIQLQQARVHRRQQHSALMHIDTYVAYRLHHQQQLVVAKTFSIAVEDNRARYYLLLWNYELKYKSVVQHLYDSAVQHHLLRHAPVMQICLYNWLKQCKVDTLHREQVRAVQLKLLRQNYAHFFGVWHTQYLQFKHRRDVAQLTSDVQLRTIGEAFSEWRACLYDNLADEKQYKHVQVQMYERNTPLAQQYRANLVLNLLQHSNKRHQDRVSVQHFCFVQLRRYVQYRKQQVQLIEQAEIHYMKLLEKHTFIIWQYKLYQADKVRQCELLRVKHCFKRGVSAFVTNILQHQLHQKNNELCVQYWKYNTTRLVFNVIHCVQQNNVAIANKFDTLLVRRYFATMHEQFVYVRMLRQQEALCVKHYDTSLTGAVLHQWLLMYRLEAQHTADVETRVGFVQLHLQSSKQRALFGAWRQLTHRRVQRQAHCAAVDMVVETIWLRNVFMGWKRNVTDQKQRNDRYIVYQAFYSWKIQWQNNRQSMLS